MTAWGRMYCGIHFPFDMLGSLTVGILSAFLILKLKSHLSPLNGRVVYIYEKSSQYIRGRVGWGER
jgi:undecaprenyl-diphosphatase